MSSLKTLELNTETGEFKVNGQNLSDVSKFNLHFENGLFHLEVANCFYATGKIIRPKDKDVSVTEGDSLG